MKYAQYWFCTISFLNPFVTQAYFSDIKTSHQHFEAIESIQNQEIIGGYADGTYRPDQTINRAEFLKIIIESRETEMFDCEILYNLKDVEWNSWYGQYVQIGLCDNLVQGYPDQTFRPSNAINFAEAAKIIVGALSLPVPQYFRAPDNWYDPYIDSLASQNASPRENIRPEEHLTRGEMAEIIYRIQNNEQPVQFNAQAALDLLKNEARDQNINSLSALVFKENKILFEANLGPTTETDLFLLASVSKVFTATALLQLYEQDRFKLDDPVNEYLDFYVTHPEYDTDITFRMLLTHTASIADGPALDDQYYDNQDSPMALAYFLENYFSPEGEFYDDTENFYEYEPGTKFEYSNTGNTLIGLLVEEISGQDFKTYTRTNIFEPLWMKHTFWSLESALENDKNIIIPFDGAKALDQYTFTDYPNGGLRSTSQDLFKFLSALTATSETKILRPQTVVQMTQPQISKLNPEMGWHLFKFDQALNLWGHDGGENGASTIMAFDPITKAGAIILTNQSDVELDGLLLNLYRISLN